MSPPLHGCNIDDCRAARFGGIRRGLLFPNNAKCAVLDKDNLAASPIVKQRLSVGIDG